MSHQSLPVLRQYSDRMRITTQTLTLRPIERVGSDDVDDSADDGVSRAKVGPSREHRLTVPSVAQVLQAHTEEPSPDAICCTIRCGGGARPVLLHAPERS